MRKDEARGHKMSRRGEAGPDCLAPRSAVVCHTRNSLSQLRSDATDGGPGLLQDLASVPKHLVVAEIGLVPHSGPGHQAAAVSSNTVMQPLQG